MKWPWTKKEKHEHSWAPYMPHAWAEFEKRNDNDKTYEGCAEIEQCINGPCPWYRITAHDRVAYLPSVIGKRES